MKHNIDQLTFNFTTPFYEPKKPLGNVPWRIQAIALRHHLPMAQASFYAAQMGISVGEVR